MDDFQQKSTKVVRIVLYRLTISQSDCRQAGPYQLPYDKRTYFNREHCYHIGQTFLTMKKCVPDREKQNVLKKGKFISLKKFVYFMIKFVLKQK